MQHHSNLYQFKHITTSLLNLYQLTEIQVCVAWGNKKDIPCITAPGELLASALHIEACFSLSCLGLCSFLLSFCRSIDSSCNSTIGSYERMVWQDRETTGIQGMIEVIVANYMKHGIWMNIWSSGIWWSYICEGTRNHVSQMNEIFL
jgi:hypothetical protein